MGTGDFSHYMSKMSDRINLGEGFILVHSFVAGSVMAFMERSMTAFMAAEETPVKTQSNLPTPQQPIRHHRPQVTLTQKVLPP